MSRTSRRRLTARNARQYIRDLPFVKRFPMYAMMFFERVMIWPRQIWEDIRTRLLFLTFKAAIWLFDGVELVVEADRNVLVHSRRHRSGGLCRGRHDMKLKRGEVFLYLGDWNYD